MTLNELLGQAHMWPEHARRELMEIASEIDAELRGEVYRAGAAELAGIDRGLRDSAEGRFASEADVEAVFARHRPK